MIENSKLKSLLTKRRDIEESSEDIIKVKHEHVAEAGNQSGQPINLDGRADFHPTKRTEPAQEISKEPATIIKYAEKEHTAAEMEIIRRRDFKIFEKHNRRGFHHLSKRERRKLEKIAKMDTSGF